MFKPDKTLSNTVKVNGGGTFKYHPQFKESLKKFPNTTGLSEFFSSRGSHFAYMSKIEYKSKITGINHLIFDGHPVNVSISGEELAIIDIILNDNGSYCCSICKKPESNGIMREELRRINHNGKNIDQQYEGKFFGKGVDKVTLSEDGKNIAYIGMEKQSSPPFSIFSVFVNGNRISNPSEDILNNSLVFLSNQKDVAYSYSEISEGGCFRKYSYSIGDKKVLGCIESFPRSENPVSNFNQYDNGSGYFFKVVTGPLLDEHRVVDGFHLLPTDFDLPYYVKSFGINKFNLEYEDGIFKRSYTDEKGGGVVVTRFKLNINQEYIILEDLTNGTHKFIRNTENNLLGEKREEWIGGNLTNGGKFITINGKKFLLSFLLKKTGLETKN